MATTTPRDLFAELDRTDSKASVQNDHLTSEEEAEQLAKKIFVFTTLGAIAFVALSLIMSNI